MILRELVKRIDPLRSRRRRAGGSHLPCERFPRRAERRQGLSRAQRQPFISRDSLSLPSPRPPCNLGAGRSEELHFTLWWQ
jgi:hypothetical protein